MVTIETELIKAKKDECGRRITPKAERERLISAYKDSGMTQRGFARRERIKYTTFVAWVQEDRKSRSASVNFAEVTGRLPSAPALLEAQLPGGILVRGQASELAQLLRLLRC